jgi:hypothetical protein
MYRQALADFDFVIANDRDGSSPAIVRGAQGNPITMTSFGRSSLPRMHR